jgi:replication factor A1
MIQNQAFDFKTIDEIMVSQNLKTIDFIGIVHAVTPIASITLKNGVKKEKRTLSMADDSGKSISLCFWGDQATMSEYDDHPIIAVKAVRVSNYGGKSLNCLEESTIVINPNIKKASEIKDWYKRFLESGDKLVGVSFDCTASSLENAQATERFLIEIDEFLHAQFQQNPDKGVYFTINGYINNIKADDKCIYMACPEENCCKKVYYQQDLRRYRCEH